MSTQHKHVLLKTYNKTLKLDMRDSGFV